MKILNRRFDFRYFTAVTVIVIIVVFIFASCSTTSTTEGETEKLATDSDSIATNTDSYQIEHIFSETSFEETTLETTVESSTETTTKKITKPETTSIKTTTVIKSTSNTTTESVSSSASEDYSDTSRKKLFDSITLPDLVSTTDSTTNKNKVKYDSNGNVDLSCFDNCAFVGNSRLLAAGNYGLVKHVYAKVGLNVNTVFTEKCEGSSCCVIDELDGKKYEKVFLMFGDNECGWGSMDAFEKQYSKVVKAVHQKIPDAEIYLLSVLPISKSKSDKNEYGCNINSIRECNKHIRNVANSEMISYIDAGQSIADENGYLPEEASTDGCHLGKEYTRKWLEYVAVNM